MSEKKTHWVKNLLMIITMIIINISPAGAAEKRNRVMIASWYGPGLQGNDMANGKKFNMNDPTVAAHKTLELGTRLRVKNPDNNKTIIVVVKDRGPYVEDRQLDLSMAAAQKLGFIEQGVTKLEVKILSN